MTEESTVNIGGILRTQREKLGYSIPDVAQHTCIRKTYLESIEDNQFSDLPGKAYVVGFIQNYARYLGLDSKPLLSQLEESELSNESPSLKLISTPMHQSKRFNKSAAGGGWSTLVLGLIAVLILGSAIYFLLPMFQAEDPVEVISDQLEAKQEPVQVQEEATAVAVPAAEASAEEVTGVEGPSGGGAVVDATAEETTAEQTSGEASGDGEKEPDEVNMSPKETLASDDVVSQPQQQKPSMSVPEGGASLRMLALNKSSLKIYVDGYGARQYKLHDGLDLTWKVKKSVKVELADPGAADFWLSGQRVELNNMKSFYLQQAVGE